MKNKNTNSGITLIALIITIIVMLILVSVTITMAVNGGLFEYASSAGTKMNQAIAKEQELANLEVNMTVDELINKYTGVVDPNLLNIGDYISNYPVEYTNVPSRVTSSQDYDCFPADEFIGWRVLSKETDEQGNILYVKLISAGVPLNYKQGADLATLSQALTTDFFKTEITNTKTDYKFYNCGFKNVTGTTLKKTFENQFTDKVQALTYSELVKAAVDLGGSEPSSSTSLKDPKYKNLLAVPCKEPNLGYVAKLWIPMYNGSDYTSMGIGGYLQGDAGANCYGIRVVVFLNSNVKFKSTTEINGTPAWEITV